jgi:hypothetical protein
MPVFRCQAAEHSAEHDDGDEDRRQPPSIGGGWRGGCRIGRARGHPAKFSPSVGFGSVEGVRRVDLFL